ncbi:MAG: hypothetical protein ACKOU7_05145 [Ferruginibacter sp.]
MLQTFISFRYCPGGENEGGGTAPQNEQANAGDQQPDSTDKPKHKGFIEKVKDALKEWSNEDQLEQDIDDATP